MNPSRFIPDIDSFASFLALILIQTTAVGAAGFFVARMLRRRGAAIQSDWYRTLLVAAMLAPCASALIGLGPLRVRIPLPFDWQIHGAREAGVAPIANASPTAEWIENQPISPPHGPKDLRGRPPAVADQTVNNAAAVQEQTAAASNRDRAASPASVPRWSWAAMTVLALLAMWILVSAALIGRIAWSMVGAIRLIRASSNVEPELAARCRQLATRLNVRTPALGGSPFVTGACVFGWRRPVILLSDTEAGTSDDVLIHELAHVARNDCLWKLLAEFAVVVLWFQPLLWRLKSRMQECAEDVCDDYVLQFGAERCDYADHLTRIAERFVPLGIRAGIGVVSFRSSLGHRVARILDSSRQLQTRTGPKTIAGLLCGALAVLQAVSLIDIGRPSNRATAATVTNDDAPPSAPSEPIKLTPAKEEHGDVITVRGQVSLPDGQPAVGAKVSAIWDSDSRPVQYRPIATVTTSSGGRFELVYRKSQVDKVPNRTPSWQMTVIQVESKGCACQWRYGRKIDSTKLLVFKLLSDFPIHGRVVDLQGQPVAGVAVCLGWISEWRDGTADAWLERFKRDIPAASPSPILASDRPPGERTAVWAVTNQDGRFVLRGMPAERLVEIVLRGETIRNTQLTVMTRNMSAINHGPSDFTRWIHKIYGAEFTYPADPGHTVFGTVSDARSGKPLPGVRVYAWRTGRSVGERELTALTDSKGNYRLVGLPNEKKTGLLLEPFPWREYLFRKPGTQLPYLMRETDVPVSPGFQATRLDVQLHRGLWITGRAIDKVTGKPVIARIYYLPFRDNPFARRLPEYHERSIDGEDNETWTQEDGTFRIVGLPGRAILGGWTATGGIFYRAGVGASAIQGMDKRGRFPTYGYMPPSRKWPEVLKEINPKEGTEEVHCDLVFDPGQTIHVSLVDRDGKPMNGCEVDGWASLNDRRPKPSTFDIVNLTPGEQRPILIRQDQLRLGKCLVLNFTDKTPRSMTITLEPCEIVQGRLVDREGAGLRGTVQPNLRPGGDFWPSLAPSVSQSNGNFEVDLPPGGRYSLMVDVQGHKSPRLSRQFPAESGTSIDLGEIKLQRQRR